MIGELIWPGRCYPEVVECLRHEALVNHALADPPPASCARSTPALLPSVAIAGAELTHPSLGCGDRTRRPSTRYGEPIELFTGRRWEQNRPSRPCPKSFRRRSAPAARGGGRRPVVAMLSPDRRADLVFAVNEVATNSVRHGDGDCTTRLWQDGTTSSPSCTCTRCSSRHRRSPPPRPHRRRARPVAGQPALRPGRAAQWPGRHVGPAARLASD